MTDTRLGERFWSAVRALPRGAGLVFRHHDLDLAARRRLFRQVLRLARARDLVVVVAGDHPLGPGAAGQHNAERRRRGGLQTRAVHDWRDIGRARRAYADATFVSPVFATRSHPGGTVLGRWRAAALARRSDHGIALGGVTPARARSLQRLGFAGWAAIDAWAAAPRYGQKRKAVPI